MRTTKELAESIALGTATEWSVVECTILNQTRWSLLKRAIVRNDRTKKHYRIDYSIGSTEMQDCEMFHGEYVEFIEVESRDVIVTHWVDL